jgi:geranylgeranyl pyrophosphate synthase
MNDYAETLETARNLLASWRELPQRARSAISQDDILSTLVDERSLPKQVHSAIVRAASEAEVFYSAEARREEEEIQKLDAELAPLLAELERIQQRVDILTRERRGHEHRLSALRQYAEQARGLQALPAERVGSPESAESWLAKLPPPEPPAPATPFKSMYDA